MVRGQNNKKAAAVSEYVLIAFAVIAAVVAMTTYTQRSLQARMRDARYYMIKTVNSECDAACKAAAGLVGNNKSIPQQYEPYYAQMTTTADTENISHKRITAPGIGHTGIFKAQTQGKNISVSDSTQLPPKDAANDTMLGTK